MRHLGRAIHVAVLLAAGIYSEEHHLAWWPLLLGAAVGLTIVSGME